MILITQFKKQAHIGSHLKIGFELTRTPLVNKANNPIWQFNPSIEVYDEINLKHHFNQEQALLHRLEYDIKPPQESKHHVLVRAGLKLFKKNIQLQLKSTYQKFKQHQAIGGEIGLSYRF